MFNVADPVCEYEEIRIQIWRKAGYGSVWKGVVMETVGWINSLIGGLVGLNSYRY